MRWTPPGRSSPRPSKLRAARGLDVDEEQQLGDPPGAAPWVNDDEDAVRYELTEAGPIALVDGNLEHYRELESIE